MEVVEQESLIQAKLPSYLSDAFGEVYEEDGLVVLGQGLGLLPLLASFIRFYADVDHGHVFVTNSDEDSTKPNEQQQSTKVSSRQPPLVFVLGLKEAERNTIVSTLSAW